MAGEWYFIGDGNEPARPVDALVRVGAELHDVVETRWFSDATEALGTSGLGRMAWGDYDGDGDDDLLVDGNRLYRNRGDGTFEDVSEAAGIAGRPTNGGVWADYDNDGNLDFYATVHNYLPACDAGHPCAADGFECDAGQCRAVGQTAERDHDLLWRGNGDGTFTDVSESAGRPYDYLPTEGAAWGDMDGDGFVDLYVANYETPTSWTDGALSRGTEDYLWRNRGDGTFEDVSEAAGIRVYRPAKCGRGVAWVDYDDDGWADIYVANYRLQFNYLWRNLGFGAFENVAFDVGVAGEEVNQAFGHSIGATWGDLDNDGDWDLIVANLAHPRFIEFSNQTRVYLSSGGGRPTFTDVFATSGISYYETHSDPALGDFDNDGLLDLFVTGVYVGYRSFLYRNLGGATFADVTYPAGTLVDNGWGVAWADYDGDGDLDLASRSLYRNDRTDLGHWLKLRLVGVLSNRSAIGARVTVTAGGQTMMRQVEGGKGTTTQSSLTLHFGLGAAAEADEVVIDWPSFPAYQERFTAVRGDRTATFVEGAGEVVDAGAADAAVTADASGAPPDGSGDGCGCSASADRPAAGLVLVLLAAVARLRRRRGRRV
jgi:MYXO-CTERM domain-containing protein